MDINPINPGHVLVMPRQHYAQLREVPTEVGQALFSAVTQIEKVLWNLPDIQCEGTNVIQNNGRAAWQDVFHVHFHVIPRIKGGYV